MDHQRSSPELQKLSMEDQWDLKLQEQFLLAAGLDHPSTFKIGLTLLLLRRDHYLP